MVGGQFGDIGLRIGAIIQARYDSTRFPGKVLLNLPFDSEETLLSRIVERIRMISGIIPIIATSIEISDDPIHDYVVKNNIEIYRGSKENVLDRFVCAALRYKLDIIVRVTGDNPIVLIDVLEKAIINHIDKKVDYTRNIGLPYGTSFEIINFSSLERALSEASKPEEFEHVTLYIKNNRSDFRILENDFSFYDFYNQGVRLTVDYPSDYAVMNILFQNGPLKKNDYNLHTIKEILRKYDWLTKVNSNNLQKKQFENEEQELTYAYELLIELGLFNASKLIISNEK